MDEGARVHGVARAAGFAGRPADGAATPWHLTRFGSGSRQIRERGTPPWAEVLTEVVPYAEFTLARVVAGVNRRGV